MSFVWLPFDPWVSGLWQGPVEVKDKYYTGVRGSEGGVSHLIQGTLMSLMSPRLHIISNSSYYMLAINLNVLFNSLSKYTVCCFWQMVIMNANSGTWSWWCNMIIWPYKEIMKSPWHPHFSYHYLAFPQKKHCTPVTTMYNVQGPPCRQDGVNKRQEVCQLPPTRTVTAKLGETKPTNTTQECLL